jgi:glycosyltransferase involved in cell wall biosynthesis
MSTATDRLKIAYVTATDAQNKHSWSGTDYYIWVSLQKHLGDITLIRPNAPKILILLLKIFHGFSLLFFKKRFDWRHSTLLSKAYSRNLEKELDGKSFDLIVAPASDTLIAYVNTAIPAIYINDRTVAGALNYHKMLSNLWSFSKNQSIQTDRAAIEKSLFVAYPSQWASQSAIKHYHIAKEKVQTIPFGANMDIIPDKNIAAQRKRGSICKLLFIGVNWIDKGGSIAFDCLQELLKMGIDAELTVCGCIPPAAIKHEKLNVIPFLNKNITEEFEQLKQLWIDSTFLILPTRIDAYGIVFCEAAAYGLPSLGSDTGGVAAALHDKKNGYLMDYTAGGKEYAMQIAEIFNDESKYTSIALSAREEFERELNWDAWAIKIKSIVKTIY